MFVGGVHEGSQGTGNLQAKKVIRFHNLHLTCCILIGERQRHWSRTNLRDWKSADPHGLLEPTLSIDESLFIGNPVPTPVEPSAWLSTAAQVWLRAMRGARGATTGIRARRSTVALHSKWRDSLLFKGRMWYTCYRRGEQPFERFSGRR